MAMGDISQERLLLLWQFWKKRFICNGCKFYLVVRRHGGLSAEILDQYYTGEGGLYPHRFHGSDVV